MTRKIFFGGSFFPPHKAHCQMIRQALLQDKEAILSLVPTKQNPLKESPGASFELIEAWLEDLANELSYQQFERILLETVEMTSDEEKSFTVDTLEKLKDHATTWTLLVGSDSFDNFLKWKEPAKILSQLSGLWIVPRGEESIDEIKIKSEKILFSLKSQLRPEILPSVENISSSQIRLMSSDAHATSQDLTEFLSPHVLTVWKRLSL